MIAISPRAARLPSITGYYGFVLIGWNAVLIPSLIRSVEHDFRQSDAAFALFYFISSLVYAGGAFSGGFLIERMGRRAVLASGALLLGVGLAGQALAPVWPVLILAALPVNWGAGVLDGGINGLFLDLYHNTRGGALNLLHLFFGIGALAAPFVVGLLVSAGVSWRAIVLVAVAGALPLCAILATVALPSGRRDPAAAQTRGAELTVAERSLLPFAGLALSIACYVAAEWAVTSWVVKLLADVPAAGAAAVLSLFWAGLALGRLLSRWVAERLDYYVFTVSCLALAGLALLAAVVTPWVAVAAVLFALAGFFFGPVYPMIMAIGGTLYPQRLAALSGSLASAAVIGAVGYPPLMGLLAAHVGLRIGMIGAALLSIPTILSLLAARALARRADAR